MQREEHIWINERERERENEKERDKKKRKRDDAEEGEHRLIKESARV